MPSLSQRFPFLLRRSHRAAHPDPSVSGSSSPGETNQFLRARTEFANVYGDLARGKRNWQVMAYGLFGLLAIATLALIRLATSARVVPYVVQVDRLGQVVAVGRADELANPDDRLIGSQLASFIRSIRTVLPAAAAPAQADMVRRAYALTAPEAARFLNEYFSNPRNDPRLLGVRLSRQVDVLGVLRMPRSSTWRLQWTETELPGSGGGETRTTAWEGYVTVRLVPPTSAEAIQDNPLGIYITSISWTQIAARGGAPPGALPSAGAVP